MSSSSSPALDLMAALVIEDGRRWGECAADFQWEDAAAVLAPTTTTPYHFLTRARGGSKTSDLGGMVIATMLERLPPGSRLYGVAADRDQGRLLLDAIRGFAKRTPMLQSALAFTEYKVASIGTDCVLEILASDGAGSWGLRPDFLVLDEIAQWPDTVRAREVFEAVTSAAAKLDGRMVLLTTAGDPAHWSFRELEHARADPLWRVNEVEGHSPWLAAERVAELRRRLSPSSFARLYQNRWTSSEDRLTKIEDLRACATLAGPLLPQPGKEYAIGVDLGITRDRTAAVVAHLEEMRSDDGSVTGSLVVVDRAETWAGSRQRPVQLEGVETWLLETARSYCRATVVVDPWQAVGLTQRLRSRGVQVEEFPFTSTSVARLGGTLHFLFRSRTLALPTDEALLGELASVRLRESSPGLIRIDHEPGGHDDRAIALALVATRLLSQPPRSGRRLMWLVAS